MEWLQSQQNLVVLLEENALADTDVLSSDPIVDRLDDAPLYLLLNRLQFRGIAWRYEDDVLHFTSPDVANAKLLTVPYNVGDPLDQGYEVDDLDRVITGTIAPDTWEDLGGRGVLSFLGDVMFVRQTGEIQRHVQGMLVGLRKHGGTPLARKLSPSSAPVEASGPKCVRSARSDNRVLPDAQCGGRGP